MDKLDLNFYRNYYNDLKNLTRLQAYHHYMKNGIEEKRIKNFFEFTNFLENIKFDVNFYCDIKNLKISNTKFKNLLIYKEYEKNGDFRNEFEFRCYLENKLGKEILENCNLEDYKLIYSLIENTNKNTNKFVSNLLNFKRKLDLKEKELINRENKLENKDQHIYGINLIGITNSNCSTKDNIFLVSEYLLEKNIKVNIVDITSNLKKKLNPDYDNFFCVNPYELKEIDFSILKNKNYALWVWEFKSLPKIFKDYQQHFEKIYTPSNFCVEIFKENLDIEVEKIPITSKIHNYLDLIDDYKIKNKNLKELLNNLEDKILYGYCVDFNSSVVRKNVLNLVEAFLGLDKILLLKVRELHNHGNSNKSEINTIEKIKRYAEKSNNIFIIYDELEILDLYKFYTHLDYYISPHLGEGFGITIYDNYILGNKIISPFYSGETEYLERDRIIELDFEEQHYELLSEHPVYKEMDNFNCLNISVDSIRKKLKPNFTVNLCGIFRNNESYLIKLYKKLKLISEKYDILFNFYFFENDSIDNTKDILKKFNFINGNLKLKMVTLNDEFSKRTDMSRIEKLVNYRNELLKLRPFNTESEWTVFLDSDIEFDDDIFNNFFKSNKPDDAVAISCNGKDHKRCLIYDEKCNKDCYHYYDVAAFIDESNNSGFDIHKNYSFRCCPFVTELYIEKWFNKELIATQSSYGGFCFYKTKVLNNKEVLYSNINNCEHIGLNNTLNKFGNIYINPGLVVYNSEFKKFPKIIHKICITNSGEYFINKHINGWEDKNRGYTIELWNNQRCTEFIKENFSIEVLEAYHKYTAFAAKADLMKYCILYKIGGWYSDWKQECLEENILDILSNYNDEDFFITNDFGNEYSIENKYLQPAFMGANKNCKVLEEAIRICVENCKNNIYGEHPIDISGPGVISNAANFHKHKVSNKIKHNDNYYYFYEKKIIRHKDPELGLDQNFLNGNNYGELWHSRKSYN